MAHINIEIKAKCDDHQKIKNILKTKDAIYKGKDHQIDTYFNVYNGRLKLREGQLENYLIYYKRQNTESPKKSECILYKSKSMKLLKELLGNALGVFITVEKIREIYFIDNIKFHLDNVKKLGTFVEIEALGMNNEEEKELTKQCRYYLELFKISKNDLISVSYSDLILKKIENGLNPPILNDNNHS